MKIKLIICGVIAALCYLVTFPLWLALIPLLFRPVRIVVSLVILLVLLFISIFNRNPDSFGMTWRAIKEGLHDAINEFKRERM